MYVYRCIQVSVVCSILMQRDRVAGALNNVVTFSVISLQFSASRFGVNSFELSRDHQSRLNTPPCRLSVRFIRKNVNNGVAFKRSFPALITLVRASNWGQIHVCVVYIHALIVFMHALFVIVSLDHWEHT